MTIIFYLFIYLFSQERDRRGSQKLEMLAKVGLVPARSQIYTHNYCTLCAGVDSLGLHVGKISVLGL